MRNLYLFQDNYCTAIFTDKCLELFLDVVKFWGGGLVAQYKDKYLLTKNINSYLYKVHNYRNSCEIAWIYRKRFGRVLRTILILDKNNDLFFKRELVGRNTVVKNKYFTLCFEKYRKYIPGRTLWDYFSEIHDIEVIKRELEIFVGFVLSEYRLPNSNMLNNKCYDVALANTVITDSKEYRFFDFEFLMNGGVNPSYLVYRIVHNSSFVEQDKQMLYSYLCNKFCIQDTWYFWDKYHDVTEQNMLLPPKTDNHIYLKSIKRTLCNMIGLFSKRVKYELIEKYTKTNKSLYDKYFRS